MCDYCDKENTEESLRGSDGIYHDENGEYYLYIEHFHNEKYFIKVDYCPKCGEKLIIEKIKNCFKRS
jgi:hypothetical protein